MAKSYLSPKSFRASYSDQGWKLNLAAKKIHLVKNLFLRRCHVENLLERVLHFLLVEPPREEGSRRLRRRQLDGLFVDDADAALVVVVIRRTDPAEDGHLLGPVALRGAEVEQESSEQRGGGKVSHFKRRKRDRMSRTRAKN